MKFTQAEMSKVVAMLLAQNTVQERALPIEIGMAEDNNEIIPTISKLSIKKNEDTGKESKSRKLNMKIDGAEESEDTIIKASINTYAFVDASGNERTIKLADVASTDLVEVLKLAQQATEFAMAIRNVALISLATHEDMVDNASIMPATGIVLADRLVSEGRVAHSLLKGLAEAQVPNEDVANVLLDHQEKKALVKASDAIANANLESFVNGCKSAVKHIEKNVKSKKKMRNIPSSSATPVVKTITEAKVKEIKRNTSSKTKKFAHIVG